MRNWVEALAKESNSDGGRITPQIELESFSKQRRRSSKPIIYRA